jgi:L-iditol 2-dehydrogenase
VPDSLPFEEAAMAEPLSIAAHAAGAVHAAGRVGNAHGGVAIVVGAGVIGLLAMQVLRARGFTVVAADVAPDRLELARALGADAVLDTGSADAPEEMRKLTGGRGADVAIEAVGIPPTVRLAILCLRKGGAVSLVGNLCPDVQLPLQAVVTRELSIFGSCASRGEYPLCLDLMERRVVDVRSLISAVAPLEEGASWIKRLYEREPKLLKVILAP